jgi:hypothetical protein
MVVFTQYWWFLLGAGGFYSVLTVIVCECVGVGVS